MRVLQLTQRFPPALGGVEDHVWHLARGLSAEGVHLDVFTTDLRKDIPFERLGGDAETADVPVRRFRAVRLAELPHAIGNVSPGMVPGLLAGEWDVVHAHAYGYFPTYVGAAGRMLRRGALVITPHADPGTPSVAKRAFDRVVPRLTLRRADRVVALTRREAHYLASLGVDRERIAVIPNGVDAAEFPPVDRAGRGTVQLLFAGRCYPRQKGLEVLLRAMALLPKDGRVRLRIVGEDWGGYAVVRSLIRGLELDGRAALVGRVSREALREEYARADVFVLPSRFDSFPIAILEAMAAGLPVVATRVGGVPEIVEDGQTGLLVGPGEALELADAIQRLVEDEGMRLEMGSRGREKARLYSWSEVIPKVKRLYEEALADRRS